MTKALSRRQLIRREFILQLVAGGVIANGLMIIATTFINQLTIHNGSRVNDIIVSLPLISGLTLVYLGGLLHRHKRAALLLAIPLYTFILGTNSTQLFGIERPSVFVIVRSVILPLVVVSSLLAFRRSFTVKSDIRSFTLSLRFIGLILLVTLGYGVSGYTILDERDFHQEISMVQALHNTMDQFNFTTDPLVPTSKRAQIFVDSLNVVSTVALGYAFISLFQPLRARLADQANNRTVAERLLRSHSRDSEDYFKVWPHDKTYYFDPTGQTALAYRVQRGVALIAGDPFGNRRRTARLLTNFGELCHVNDWLPAFIHVRDSHRNIYQKHGFQLQKIGEEAVVDISQFQQNTAGAKYFRQIQNKFAKHGYTCEVLRPPHNDAIIARLRDVSDSWLKQPGRQERGFMMGYFSATYIKQCNLVVARDAAGTIQGFLNQVPTFQKHEANYDLLRHSNKALGNINDYLLMEFMRHTQAEGFTTVNLGLCPFSGVGLEGDDKSLIDAAIRFAYANGDRFYSFSGLRKFKAKYNPEWRERYVVYKGGIRGFTRTLRALNQAMKLPHRKRRRRHHHMLHE